MTTVLIVAYPGDHFAEAVAGRLERSKSQVLCVEPSQMPDLTVALRGDRLTVNGQAVGGVLARCPSNAFFSESFSDEDQSFVSTEIRAVWLAATQLPSVYAVNRLDPVAYFDDSEWSVWRTRLMSAGIPVSPFSFGNISPSELSHSWLPSRSLTMRVAPDPVVHRVIGAALTISRRGASYAYVGDQLLAKDSPATVVEAQGVLLDHGLRLAEITLDEQERVLLVNPLPIIEPPDQAADLLAEAFRAHLHLC